MQTEWMMMTTHYHGYGNQRTKEKGRINLSSFVENLFERKLELLYPNLKSGEVKDQRTGSVNSVK